MFSWACSGTFKCCTGIALGQAQRTPRGNNSSGSIYWGKYLHCEGGGAPTPLEWISVSLFGPMFECLCIHLRLQQFIYCYNTYDELKPNRLNETLELKCSPDGPFIRMSRASSDHLPWLFILRDTTLIILMVSLKAMNVKCKFRKSLKEWSCASTVDNGSVSFLNHRGTEQGM